MRYRAGLTWIVIWVWVTQLLLTGPAPALAYSSPAASPSASATAASPRNPSPPPLPAPPLPSRMPTSDSRPTGRDTMLHNESPEYLLGLLHELCRLPKETEWLEFKLNAADPEQIGEYISALANSAALCGKANAYVVWGVTDATHRSLGASPLGRNQRARKRGAGHGTVRRIERGGLPERTGRTRAWLASINPIIDWVWYAQPHVFSAPRRDFEGLVVYRTDGADARAAPHRSRSRPRSRSPLPLGPSSPLEAAPSPFGPPAAPPRSRVTRHASRPRVTRVLAAPQTITLPLYLCDRTFVYADPGCK